MKEREKGLPNWLERAIAFAAFCGLSPVLLICALAVRISSPGPILFRQERVGKGGKPFRLLKFRSMRVNAAGAQVTALGDPRITPVGRVLRKTKLDEIPELWNVVRGELSLVGPRPEVPRYVNLGDPMWRCVLSVRPGITDPVTLRLRNEENLMAAADGDRELFYTEILQPYKLRGYWDYINKRTAWSDLMVLIRTFWAVIWPPGAPPPTLEEVRREGV
jgi:lipopolysaccharide/colanic/teichoic acid biosynthesis glycosyltransferase